MKGLNTADLRLGSNIQPDFHTEELNMQNDKPWEEPRIKRILELFGGRIVKITKCGTKEVKANEADIQR
jgi:hypothetical protein